MPPRYLPSISTRPAASEVSNTLKAYARTPGSPAPSYHPSNARQVLIHTSPYRLSQSNKPKSLPAAHLQYYDLGPKGTAPVSAARFQKNGREGFKMNHLRIPKELKEQDSQANVAFGFLPGDERTLSTEFEQLCKTSGLNVPEDERSDSLGEKLHNLPFFARKSTDTSTKLTTSYHLSQAGFFQRLAGELGDAFYHSLAEEHNRMAYSVNNNFLRAPSSEGKPRWLRRKAFNFHKQYIHISTKVRLLEQDIAPLVVEDLQAMMYWNHKKARQVFFARHNKDHPFVAFREGPDASPYRYDNSSYPKIAHEGLTFLKSFASDSDKLSTGPSERASLDVKRRLESINFQGLLAKEAIMLLRAHLAQCRAVGVETTKVFKGGSISAALRDMLPSDLEIIPTGGDGSYLLKLQPSS